MSENFYKAKENEARVKLKKINKWKRHLFKE